MALSDSDLAWYPSTSGSSSGGTKGATPITSGVDNNLWPDVTSGELLAGGTRYRKIFVANNSGADSWLKPVIWISVPPTNITESIGLGFDDADDDDSAGGVFTQFSGNAVLEAVSDGADTRNLDIFGVSSASVPTKETIALNGTTPVASSTTWSKIWAVHASAVSASRSVSLKQGAGGTLRGTLAVGFTNIWVWVAATSKGAGIALPDLAAGSNYGLWRRHVWAASTSGVRPNDNRVKAQEA